MEPPIPPDEEDCCNSGCSPCILDVYEEKLKKYNKNKTVEATALKNCISDTSYTIFKLISKEKHTKDTHFFTFQYVKPYRDEIQPNFDDLTLNFKPGQHFILRGSLYNDTEVFSRSYTPLPAEDLPKLQFKILVKFYEHGCMSKYLDRLKINSETVWRGPYGDFSVSYSFKHVLMIAQGVGIAPLYGVIKNMVYDEYFESFIKLYFCCRSLEDVLLRDEIYGLSSFWNFDYEVFLSNSEVVDCKYNETVRGRRLGGRDIRDFLAGKNCGEVQILICGTEDFSRCILGFLGDFNRENVYVF